MLSLSMASLLLACCLSLFLLHMLSVKLVSLLRWKKLWLIPASIGTPIHELSHAITAIVLGHRVHRVQLFSPQPDGGLGYVEHTHRFGGVVGMITTTLISLAPIAGGLGMVYVITLLLYPSAIEPSFSEANLSFWGVIASSIEHSKTLWSEPWGTEEWIWLLLVTSIIAFMAPSPADYRNALPGLAISAASLVLVAGIFREVEYVLMGYALSAATALTPILAVVASALIISIAILLAANAVLTLAFRRQSRANN